MQPALEARLRRSPTLPPTALVSRRSRVYNQAAAHWREYAGKAFTVDGLHFAPEVMSWPIATTLQKYLASENIQYEGIPHELSMTSTRTAETCRISGDRLAKSIVLRRGGEYMLAILPASHHLRLSDLRTSLGEVLPE